MNTPYASNAVSKVGSTHDACTVQDENVVKLHIPGQGNGELFWSDKFQKLVREHRIHRYFPVVTPGKSAHESDTSFWKFAVGGRSFEIDPIRRCIPASEINGFAHTLDSFLKECLNKSEIRDSAAMASALLLPDPYRSPELYRLTGSPYTRCLVVLWGCYFHHYNPIPHDQAIEKLRKLAIPFYETVLRYYVLPLMMVGLLAVSIPYGVNSVVDYFSKEAIANVQREAAQFEIDANALISKVQEWEKGARSIVERAGKTHNEVSAKKGTDEISSYREVRDKLKSDTEASKTALRDGSYEKEKQDLAQRAKEILERDFSSKISTRLTQVQSDLDKQVTQLLVSGRGHLTETDRLLVLIDGMVDNRSEADKALDLAIAAVDKFNDAKNDSDLQFSLQEIKNVKQVSLKRRIEKDLAPKVSNLEIILNGHKGDKGDKGDKGAKEWLDTAETALTKNGILPAKDPRFMEASEKVKKASEWLESIKPKHP